MRILQTGTTTFFSPRLLQGFGMRGAEVTAADSLKLSAGKASRWTSRAIRLPLLGREPGGYLDALLAELRSRPYDLLLPTFEESLLLAEYQDEIRSHTELFLPSFESIISLHFKPALYERCRDWGIRCPESAYPVDQNVLESETQHLRYPLIVKPAAGNNSIGKSVSRNREELRASYNPLLSADPQFPPLVQEKIDGELICNLMFCRHGRKYGEVIYRNLRTLPDEGGTSVIRESIDHPEIARITERLAAVTHWSGFLGLDFLVERGTNTPFLIDANPRANPGVMLGYLAGVDWTGIILELLAGRKPTPVQGRPGVRACSLIMDIAWLIDGFRFGRGFFRRASSRLKRFFLPEWKLDRRTDLVTWGDFKPTLMLTLHAVLSLVKAAATGRPSGQEALSDVNYDPVTAARLAGRSPNLMDLLPVSSRAVADVIPQLSVPAIAGAAVP